MLTILGLALAAPQVGAKPLLPSALADPEGGAALAPTLFERPRRAWTRGATGGPNLAQRTASSTFESLNQDPEGDMPRDAAFTSDGERILVVNRDTDNVTVFDFATRTVVATIAVGDFPVDVELSPNGQFAAVPNLLDDTVSIIDVASLSVTATVPVTQTSGEGQPYRVAFDAGTGHAVVSVIDDAIDSRFSVIDPTAGVELRSFTTSSHGAYGFFGTPESAIFGNLFTDWALSPDGAYVLVPDRGGDVLNSYDVATGALLASVPVGDVPSYVDISEDGSTAACTLSGTLDALVVLATNGGAPTITGTVPTSVSAFDPQVRITPSGTEAVVGVQNAIEFFSLGTLSGLGTVSTGTVGDLEFTSDDQYLVVSNFTTRVIDLATRSVVRSLSLAPSYDAAISPVSPRYVSLNNRFREDVHFYGVDGSLASVLGTELTGSAPEVDAPRRMAATPDGTRVLVAGLTSNSVVERDLTPGGGVTAVYPVGLRVWEVAVDPAGTTAVVTSMDSSTVQILDLATGTVATTLSISTRPTEIAISPDGTRAYVTTVAGTDRLHFIDLAGAASAVTGSIPTGQLGSLLYNYNQSSGIALSPDGATLAVCVSFDDELLLVDTQSQTEIVRVPVGDFPLRAAWSADGSSLYVGCPFDDTVQRVDFAGASSSVGAVGAGVMNPFQIVPGPDGDYLYVGENDASADGIAVLDAQTLARVGTVSLTAPPAEMERFGDTLFVAAGGTISRVVLDGPASAVVDSALIAGTPADLAFAAGAGVVVTTQPGAEDGIDVTRFGTEPVYECFSPANSTGQISTLVASGTTLAGGFPLRLSAGRIPQGQFGLLLASRDTAVVPNAGGSVGTLCLGGVIGRFNSLLAPADAAGQIELDVDTTAIPEGGALSSVLAGESWSFQLWHRDVGAAGPTSNFTNRATVAFE
ncbi:MAG: cytochrome D1 domain-containing protein [Planctomycetota bacterium]